MMNELDKAAVAYEYSLRHNPYNIQVNAPSGVDFMGVYVPFVSTLLTAAQLLRSLHKV